MTSSRLLFSAILWIALAACQTMSSGEDEPATIDQPTDASRAELQHAVNSALGTEVMLADDAFTASSVLTIERNQPRTMQNPVPQGRVMDMPFQFRLVKRGDDCFLVDQRDATRFLLENTSCVAE